MLLLPLATSLRLCFKFITNYFQVMQKQLHKVETNEKFKIVQDLIPCNKIYFKYF